MTETTSATSQPGRQPSPGDQGAQPGMPPAPGHWSTRAALLRDRAAALRVLHRADLSLRAVGKTALAVVASAFLFGLAGAAAFGSGDEAPGEEPGADEFLLCAICLLVAAVLGGSAARRTLHARDVGLRRRAWEDLADATEARALPRGNLDPTLREPFDARTDPDGDEFVGSALVGMYVAPWEGRLLVRAVPAGMGVMAGAACLIAPLAQWNPGLSGLLLAGPLMLSASGIQMFKSTQRSWRATQRWKFAKREHDQWRAQRSTGS